MKNILYSIIIAAAMTCNILPAMAEGENVSLTLNDTPASYEAFRIGVWSQRDGTLFDITYTRDTYMQGTNNGGTEYGTICLPFYINTKPTNMTLYHFGNINGNTLDIVKVRDEEYTDGKGISPGTPLIFKLNSPATTMSITCNGTRVNKYGTGTSLAEEKVWIPGNTEEGISTGDGTEGFIWIRGYDEMTTLSSTDANQYYYIYNDKFYRAQTQLIINPFRVVMKFIPKPSQQAKPSAISIREVPAGSTNGISTASATEAPVTGIYSINGSKQTTMRRGLNIIRQADGTTRKVVVK